MPLPFSPHIRAITSADIEACMQVCSANHPEYIASHEIEDFLRFLTDKPYAPSPYFVVEVGKRLVACGGVAIEGAAAHLCWGLVHPSRHRQGLGTLLLEHRLKWVGARAGIERVELCTSQKTTAFYERFGFETTQVTPNGFGVGLDRYDMVLPLTNICNP